MKILRTASFATTAFALFITPAIAQMPLTEIEDDDVAVAQLNLTVDQVEDLDVIGSNGEEIGDVDDVLGDASGEALAISVDVDDGYFDLGERTVIMNLDDLRLEAGNLVTEMTADQIRSLNDHPDD